VAMLIVRLDATWWPINLRLFHKSEIMIGYRVASYCAVSVAASSAGANMHSTRSFKYLAKGDWLT